MTHTYTYKIEVDECPQNPRDTKYCDNLGKMALFHRRYDLVNETDYWKDDFNSWSELASQIERDNPGCVLLPVRMYDHGNIALSTSGGGCFSDRWDSGQVGFIFLDRPTIQKEYGWKRLTQERRLQLEGYLKSDVEVYSNYLSGEVYGYIITDETGEEVESCWGFYSYKDCEEEVESIVSHLEKEDQEELATLDTRLVLACV